MRDAAAFQRFVRGAGLLAMAALLCNCSGAGAPLSTSSSSAGASG